MSDYLDKNKLLQILKVRHAYIEGCYGKKSLKALEAEHLIREIEVGIYDAKNATNQWTTIPTLKDYHPELFEEESKK